MALDRTDIEAVLETLAVRMAKGDKDGSAALFSEDCRFRNSFLREPVIGRDQLRALMEAWPKVVNQHEWYAIDGNRLVLGWNERQPSMKESVPPYRGISTFVFDDDGLIRDYEGVFDTAAVAATLNT